MFASNVSFHVRFLRELGGTERAFDLFKVRVFDLDVARQRVFHLISFPAYLARDHGFGLGFGLVDDPAVKPRPFVYAVVVDEVMMNFATIEKEFHADAAFEKSFSFYQFLFLFPLFLFSFADGA